MRRLLFVAGILVALVIPTQAGAFHHGGLPATDCHAAAAGSPSNDNGMAKEALTAHNPHFPPALPPVGTPGEGQGDGGEHCANAHED